MFIQGWSNQFGVHYLMFRPKPVPSCVFLYDLKHVPSKNTKLVGGFNPCEKYELVSWDDYSIPNWMESHKSSKPPNTKQISIAAKLLTLNARILSQQHGPMDSPKKN